jgi:AraC family transcriptional regulator
MVLYIKNMVCNRCILVVRQELEKLHFQINNISLGEAELAKPPTTKQILQLNEALEKKQIEQIKNLLIKKVQSGEVEEHFSISSFLSKSLNKDYSYISRLFSEVEGITIEQFFILQKIEKVKEWIVYGELNLSEISYRLG